MIRRLIIATLFITLVSCNETIKESEKPREDIVPSQMENDSIGEFSVSALLDTGLVVDPSKYKVVKYIKRKFRDLEIPIKVCATFEPNGYGDVDSLIFNYNGNSHLIMIGELFMTSPSKMIGLDKLKDDLIRFEDFNFDNHPDLAVYNSTSGMKNILEYIYIYSNKYDKFIYNTILSNNANCELDSVNKTINTFAQGGMASMIYGSATYKWDDAKLFKIKSVNQDYINSLDVFVRETKVLIDSSWVITVDTLTEEFAKEWE